VSLLERAATPHGHPDAIQDRLTTRSVDLAGIDFVMCDGFSASS
jgi:hypothetical protein